MSLRRFPWKIPRASDNSFKLFSSKPTPGHDPEKLIYPSQFEDGTTHTKHPGSPEHGHGGGGHKDANQDSREKGAPSGGPEKKEMIKGPWRLLRLLPRESRHIIYRMLDIDPAKRATMAEIVREPWVANTVICRELTPGQVISADDHTHVLEPPVNTPKQ